VLQLKLPGVTGSEIWLEKQNSSSGAVVCELDFSCLESLKLMSFF